MFGFGLKIFRPLISWRNGWLEKVNSGTGPRGAFDALLVRLAELKSVGERLTDSSMQSFQPESEGLTILAQWG
jgi:hypothetical protein